MGLLSVMGEKVLVTLSVAGLDMWVHWHLVFLPITITVLKYDRLYSKIGISMARVTVVIHSI
jgi:hypothetical protein